MTIALSGLPPECAFLYIDDIIVIGCSIDHHLKNLERVFTKLQQFNLKLNPAKCHFFCADVTYLGHHISAEGIQPDKEKFSVIEKYPVPQNADEVFHICDEGKKISFLCPNGTIFRQLDLICDWWFKVDCAAAPNHYAESSEMLTQAQRARIQSRHPIPQPITSPEHLSLNIQRKHAFLNKQLGTNLNALEFNRRMDTIVEQSDESIDFEDISLKRNNVRNNESSRNIKTNSEEIQATDETVAFARSGKKLNGYNYPLPEKNLDNLNYKSDANSYDRPAKFINRNEKELYRTAKVLDNSGGIGFKNSFNFDAKPFITRATEIPMTSTTTRQQTIRATTSSSVNRGSTTHQTSTLNQKTDRKPAFNIELRNSQPHPSSNSENSNFPAYTTARKLSTKAKDKPFYTPTIPAVTNKVVTENTTPSIQASPTVSGAVEHALKMMKTLQDLEISEIVLENRPGVDVPPSSGPNALHSLALYFANDSGRDVTTITTTTTISPITTGTRTEGLEPKDNQHSISPSLLSKKTIDKYQQLFDSKDSGPTTESLRFQTRIEDESGNDLDGQFSRHPIFGSSGSPQIRELAQVFTHALSAYLQDPESFRRILTEIRPKGPTYFRLSNQIDNRIYKNEDISTEEATYFSSRQQITPAPRTVTDDLEVLDFSDITLPTTVKRETTSGNLEVTTEIPSTTTFAQFMVNLEPSNTHNKSPASNLIIDNIRKTGATYIERQSKSLKNINTESKNELADEVNEELGTLKPPAFKVVESVEDLGDKHDNNSYFPINRGHQLNSTPVPYGKNIKPANSTDTYPTALFDTQAVPLRWGEELTPITTSTDSSPTVYFELLPPQSQKLANQPSVVFLPPDREDILDDDEQLQRAQSQSIITKRNQVEAGKQAKTIYNFLSLDNALHQNKRITSTIPQISNSTPVPSVTKGHYITKQFSNEKINETTTPFPDIITASIPDTGKIAPNSKTTLSYTVFLDPLTINDGLMDTEEDAKTTVLNALTYLPRNQEKSTSTLITSTTPTSAELPLITSSTLSTKRRGKSGIHSRLSEEESNENELMDTMQRKANQMFGGLNDLEANHLMNVMKTADTNKSVRRLILLLIQTCDDDYNKTVEDSRKALLNALIKMDSQENDSSEIRIVTTRTNKKERNLKKVTSTASTPITANHDVQLEKLTGLTATSDLKNRESFETTTSAAEDVKSTILDLSYEASTKLLDVRYNSDESDISTPIISLFPEQYTTTSIPTTTTDYDTTTAALTTTDLS
ncbi:mucin-4-like, partial [Topomyia yanbarensis]|uniref:mucin-4-like n=1 Tax=Topomyia yanbarensis TaxID=2498891 RepID=UPI00273B306A